MRLTLRTMLAYLDNVLEPADSEALSQKINESDFALGLVQRIRGVMKKVRMDAPKLDGKGMGNDANTVAEYLDSSLPQDRVGDFERICLESDKHLCEVAACHQILALVLGKPAEVPLELRERIYGLGDPAKVAAPRPATGAARAGRVPAPPVERANGHPVSSPAPLEVPEYLRSGRSSGMGPLLAAAVALLLLVGAGTFAIGIFRGDHPLWQRLQKTKDVAASTGDSSAPSTPATGTETTPAKESEQTPSDGTTTKAGPAPGDIAAAPVATPATVPATAEPVPATPMPTLPPVPEVAPEAPATTAPAATAPVVAKAATPAPSTAAAPAPSPPPPATAEPPQVASKLPVAPRNPMPPPKPEEKPPVEVGRYTSDGQVLATLQLNEGIWRRKQPREVLLAGERLAVLPPFRPQIALPGVQVTFAGSGSFAMEEPGEGGTSRLLVDHGRLLVVTVGAAGSKLYLDMAGVKGTITLVDADSSLAIKVSRWLPPGTDPEAFSGMPVVEMYNMGGRIAWQEPEQERSQIPPQHVVVYIGADPPELQGPFIGPDWIDAKSISPIDRQASLSLEAALDPGKSLNIALQETAQDRRVEVRALSARCLAVLDEFDQAIRELGDNRQYSFWTAEIDALQHALSRSPHSAGLVRAALDRLRGSDGRDLYRMLWGFSPDQLEKGAAAQLVKFLEHDQMDIRVLAFHNLVAITGAQEFYRPERSPTQMRAAIQNWKERLAKGGIAYKQLPSPIEGYKPIAQPALP